MLIPYQLVSPVRADVVKAANFCVLASNHQQRGLQNLELFREITAWRLQIPVPTDHEPIAPKDGFALELEVRGRDRLLVINEFRPADGEPVGPMGRRSGYGVSGERFWSAHRIESSIRASHRMLSPTNR